jgi:hypothetical protein
MQLPGEQSVLSPSWVQSLAKRGGVPFILLLLTILFFFPALFLDQIFRFRDLFFFHYPLRHYWVSLLHQGYMPYLNSGLNGGHPILANPNYAVFYPGNLLYLLFPFDTAWNLSLAGHVFWAGLGIYWLARLLGSPKAASAAAAMIFVFGGPFLSSMTYHNLLVAGSWIPWICALIWKCWIRGGYWVPIAGLAGAFQFLAGEPTIEVITFLIVGPAWIYAILKSCAKKPQIIKGMTVLVIIGLLIGIQLIPLIEWLPETQRGQGLPFRLSAAYWSLHPARLIEFLVPHFYGNVMGAFTQDFWGEKYSDSGYPYILKLYAGWFPFILMPLAWKRKWGVATSLMIAGGILLSFGHRLPGYETFYNLFPPFRVIRYPEKFLILVSFGLAITTALALAEVSSGSSVRRSIVSGFTLLALLFLVAWISPVAGLSEAQQHMRIVALRHAAAFGILTLCIVYLAARPPLRQTFHLLIPIVIFIDLAAITWEIPATQPRKLMARTPAILEQFPELQKAPILHLGEDQMDVYFAANIDPIYFMHDVIHPLTGLSWGITYGATNDIDRMGWWKSSRRQQEVFAKFPNPLSLKILRQAGVKYILSLKELSGSNFIQLGTFQTTHAAPLYVYGLAKSPANLVTLANSSDEVRWREEGPYRISVDVLARKPDALIVARNFLSGWNGLQDGEQAKLFEADGGWIGIHIPAGQHHLELTYRPPGLTSGVLISLCGLFVMAIAFRLQKRFAGT